jgi:hypothetical protein
MLDEPSAGELTSIITTEHFTLQTARAAAMPRQMVAPLPTWAFSRVHSLHWLLWDRPQA